MFPSILRSSVKHFSETTPALRNIVIPNKLILNFPLLQLISIREKGDHGNKGKGADGDNCKKKEDNNFHRHCYHEECEKAVNEQIESELNACYSYLGIAAYFGQSNVAYPGCYAFFLQMHLEELAHAHNLIRYQNMRGGKVHFCGLKAIESCNYTIQQSFEKGLQMEKEVKEKLVSVTNVAEKHKDFSLADFLITDYIQAQEKSIQEYARLLQRYKSMSGCGHCQCTDFLFDKELHAEFSKGTNHEELKFTSDEKAFK